MRPIEWLRIQSVIFILVTIKVNPFFSKLYQRRKNCTKLNISIAIQTEIIMFN